MPRAQAAAARHRKRVWQENAQALPASGKRKRASSGQAAQPSEAAEHAAAGQRNWHSEQQATLGFQPPDAHSAILPSAIASEQLRSMPPRVPAALPAWAADIFS